MKRLSASKARGDLAEVLNQVAYRKERVLLHRRGKNVAAVVPLEDIALLEQLEDRIDNAAADRALKDRRRIPWEKVKKDLGLS